MRFSLKLVLVCEAVFVMLTIIIGATVGGMAYEKTRQGTIETYLYEADNLIRDLNLYLASTTADLRNPEVIAPSLVDLFSKEGLALQVYDTKKHLLAGRILEKTNDERADLTAALKNKGEQTLLTRHLPDGRYMAFFSQYIEKDGHGIVVAFCKDISHLDEQRHSILLFVLRSIVVGVIVVALVIWLVTDYLLRPLRALGRAAHRIALGDYSERVVIANEDEFGDLATSFNIMASAVEDNIAELEERNDAQQRMMDNLSHELRTPLTSIIGYAELLKKMPYDEAVYQKGLDYIYSEGKRMLNLNRTLLDLAYLRQDKERFSFEPIMPIFEEVAELAALRAEQQGIALQVEPTDIAFDMDGGLLRSLLTNLVDNAIKASSAGGEVRLSARREGEEICLAVADKGKGMSPEALAHIREPFYQVDSARSRNGKDDFGGLGLGLAIVDQIVRKHGGTIRFESEEGVGTLVEVLLPERQE